MIRGVLSTLSLEPYSSESVLFCCGYSAQEMHDWVQEQYLGLWVGTDRIPTLTDIKNFARFKTDLLNMILDHKEGIDKLNDEKNESRGCLFYDSEKEDYYIMVLREGFNPHDPENMTSLAHEVLHLCQIFLPKFFDRNLEMENEAYFHSHIMRQIFMKFIPDYKSS